MGIAKRGCWQERVSPRVGGAQRIVSRECPEIVPRDRRASARVLLSDGRSRCRFEMEKALNTAG